MFTGLVEDLGTIESLESGADGARVRITTRLAGEIGEGDSVAVNGVCLTATEVNAGGFATEAMNQTLEVTALGALGAGDRVNLELAMAAGDRLGGHIVQGHADGVGTVLSIEEDGFARRLRVALGPELIRYVVEKGSITVDGCSLTVVEPLEQGFRCAIIPHTMEVTVLGRKGPGDRVNLEVDVIAKYTERLLTHGGQVA